MSVRSRFDKYMAVAKEIAQDATCPRASVGVVIVRNNQILATGYNGAPTGMPECKDVGCYVVDNHCLRVNHAEENAAFQADSFGISLAGADAYVYDSLGRPGGSCVERCAPTLQRHGVFNIYGADGAVTHVPQIPGKGLGSQPAS